MPVEPKSAWTPSEVTNLCIDFGLPVIIMGIAAYLLLSGIDGEVKTIFAVASGWIFKSGITRKQAAK